MRRAAHGCRRPEISSHAAFQSGSSSAEVTLLPSRKVTMDQPGVRRIALTMDTISWYLWRQQLPGGGGGGCGGGGGSDDGGGSSLRGAFWERNPQGCPWPPWRMRGRPLGDPRRRRRRFLLGPAGAVPEARAPPTLLPLPPTHPLGRDCAGRGRPNHGPRCGLSRRPRL